MTQVSDKSPERPRQREVREEREPGTAGMVMWEHGRLFARLFNDDDGGFGGGASMAGVKATAGIPMLDALAEQLAPRLQASAQWPLLAVLYLPRMGRINASVRREQGSWAIELDAEHDATARWLSGIRQQCEERLAAALGRPVSVFVPNAGCAC